MTSVAQGSSESAAAAVAAAAEGAPAKAGGRKGLIDLIQQNMEEIGNALPPGIMEPQRFARIIMTEFRKTPKLALCTPESFMGALFQVAQLGLEPGGKLGHSFLIPYENSKLTRQMGYEVLECQLQIGYKGYVELGGRRGILLRAREVRANDEFDFDLGSHEFLHHKWKMGAEGGRGDVIGFYGKVVMPDGKVSFHVMEIPEINARRDRSSAVQYAKTHPWAKTPWDTDYDAMARKTVIHAMVPQIALAPDLQIALRADEAVIERNAHGDLSYLYRDAIDVSPTAGAPAISKEHVTDALNAMTDSDARTACFKYIQENFGRIEDLTDEVAPALLTIVTEWPAVLNRGTAAARSGGVATSGTALFGEETETIFGELDVELANQARAHLEAWRESQAQQAEGETPSDDAAALELERWLAEPQDAATEAPQAPQGAQEPETAPPATDQAPPPADPQGAAPGGVPQEVLERVTTAIDSWSAETVKQKLREWEEPVTGSEKVQRLRLVTKLAPEVAKGTPAATALF